VRLRLLVYGIEIWRGAVHHTKNVTAFLDISGVTIVKIRGHRTDQHPVVHLVGTGVVFLVVLALSGKTNFVMTLDLSMPTFGEKPYGTTGS